MNRNASRSIDQYLQQLREELTGADAALIQDALYDAEEYLGAELAAHPDKSEADVLELIAASLIEAMTGVRMPRRPVYQPSSRGLWTRVGEMLKERRTWSTLAYFLLMLPLGIIYFVTAIVGLSLSIALMVMPLVGMAQRFGWFGGDLKVDPQWLGSWPMLPVEMLAGVLLFTLLLHLARGIGRVHALFAKTLLVTRDGPAASEVSPLPLAAH